MASLVEFKLESGEAILVEMDEQQLAGFAPAANPGEVATEATGSFEKALDKLIPAARAISERMKQLSPDEVQVELGVKLTAEAGVILAKAATEANFTVTLTWKSAGPT